MKVAFRRLMRKGVGMALMLVVIVAAFAVGPARAEKRVALVIGNSDYTKVGRLANPQRDADAIAALLAKLGFSVRGAQTDLPVSAFKRALADFEIEAAGADTAVIYYSGHGIQVGGEDYLVPIDAELARDIDVPDETVPLERAEQAVAGAERLGLVILDACRDNPFLAQMKMTRRGSASRGLAPIAASTSSNLLVAFSAAPGEQALDGPPAGHSPFTEALLQRLATPGLDVQMALRQVRDDVNVATEGKQRPYVTGTLGGGIIALAPAGEVAAPPSPAPHPAPTNEFASLGEDLLCKDSLDGERTGWETRAHFSGLVDEVLRRGLTVDACRVALGLPPLAPAPPHDASRPLANVGAKDLCSDALFSDRLKWEMGPYYGQYAAEAQQRGLTIDGCRAALGLAPIAASPTSTNALENYPQDALCIDALNSVRSNWDDRASFAAKVAEAQRRGLTVDACRAALAPPPSAASPTSTSALENYPQDTLCIDALNSVRSNWDDRASFAAKVAEAQRRGLTVDACRATLGLPAVAASPPSMDTLANYPQDTLCIDALNSVRSNWDDRANFAAKVAEAQRRGLTIDACREALGLPAIVRSPPPQASPSYAEFGPVDLGTLSEKPRLIATYGDWSVYCSKAKSSKVCYSLATPKMRTPDLPKRGQSYLFVSNRPGEGVANEVSFVMGAALSPRGAPRVEIGGASFTLVAKEQNLWIKGQGLEAQFVNTSKSAAEVVVTATLMNGAAVRDTYSALGLTQAILRAAKAAE